MHEVHTGVPRSDTIVCGVAVVYTAVRFPPTFQRWTWCGARTGIHFLSIYMHARSSFRMYYYITYLAAVGMFVLCYMLKIRARLGRSMRWDGRRQYALISAFKPGRTSVQVDLHIDDTSCLFVKILWDGQTEERLGRVCRKCRTEVCKFQVPAFSPLLDEQEMLTLFAHMVPTTLTSLAKGGEADVLLVQI